MGFRGLVTSGRGPASGLVIEQESLQFAQNLRRLEDGLGRHLRNHFVILIHDLRHDTIRGRVDVNTICPSDE